MLTSAQQDFGTLPAVAWNLTPPKDFLHPKKYEYIRLPHFSCQLVGPVFEVKAANCAARVPKYKGSQWRGKTEAPRMLVTDLKLAFAQRSWAQGLWAQDVRFLGSGLNASGTSLGSPLSAVKKWLEGRMHKI